MKNARAKRAKLLFVIVNYANLWRSCCPRRRGWLSSLIQTAENIHFISETKKNTRTARAARTLEQFRAVPCQTTILTTTFVNCKEVITWRISTRAEVSPRWRGLKYRPSSFPRNNFTAYAYVVFSARFEIPFRLHGHFTDYSIHLAGFWNCTRIFSLGWNSAGAEISMKSPLSLQEYFFHNPRWNSPCNRP